MFSFVNCLYVWLFVFYYLLLINGVFFLFIKVVCISLQNLGTLDTSITCRYCGVDITILQYVLHTKFCCEMGRNAAMDHFIAVRVISVLMFCAYVNVPGMIY